MGTSIFWAAVLDGDIAGSDLRGNRESAELDAGWLRSHPARRDRVRFGSGGQVKVARVMECEFTGELVEVPCDR